MIVLHSEPTIWAAVLLRTATSHTASSLQAHACSLALHSEQHCSLPPADQFPYDTPAKNEVGWAFWWLSIVQFSAFFAMLTSRFVFFPRDALKLFDEPAQVNCCGDLDQHLVHQRPLHCSPRSSRPAAAAAPIPCCCLTPGSATGSEIMCCAMACWPYRSSDYCRTPWLP